MSTAADGVNRPAGIVYYTIYLKGLTNSSGYIDISLADDQLMKDYLQFLDIGIKSVRTYVVATPPKAHSQQIAPTGFFAVNFSEISAITTVRPE